MWKYNRGKEEISLFRKDKRMSEIKRREDESLLGFYKRITENRKELGLSYEEWGELIIGENRYSSDNCRKALYLVKPMLESLEEEQINKITDNDIIILCRV